MRCWLLVVGGVICEHWGWGAVIVDTPDKSWTCSYCQRHKHKGRHWYLFGEPRCTTCARSFHDALCTEEPYPDKLDPVSVLQSEEAQSVSVPERDAVPEGALPQGADSGS